MLQGNVFTTVCLFTEAVCLQQGRSAYRGKRVCLCGGGGLAEPPPRTRKAGTMHPTGMLSCFIKIYPTLISFILHEINISISFARNLSPLNLVPNCSGFLVRWKWPIKMCNAFRNKNLNCSARTFTSWFLVKISANCYCSWRRSGTWLFICCWPIIILNQSWKTLFTEKQYRIHYNANL